MEFKVGDTVKILDRVEDETDYSPFYTDVMLKYAGTLTTIKEITNNGALRLDNSNYFWDTKAVKPVNEAKYLHPTELKEGDFIKIWNDVARFIYIFKKYENNSIHRYASFDLECNDVNVDSDIKWGIFTKATKIIYATEEEKNLLNEALLKKGYIWNNSTKTLDTIHNLISSDNVKYNISLDFVEDNMNKEELNLFPTKKHYQLNFNY